VGGAGGREQGEWARGARVRHRSARQPLEGLERSCQSVPERFKAAAAKRGR